MNLPKLPHSVMSNSLSSGTVLNIRSRTALSLLSGTARNPTQDHPVYANPCRGAALLRPISARSQPRLPDPSLTRADPVQSAFNLQLSSVNSPKESSQCR